MAILLYASTHSPSLYCVYTPPISHSPSFSLLSLHDHTNHFLFFLLPSLPKSSLPSPHLPSPPLPPTDEEGLPCWRDNGRQCWSCCVGGLLRNRQQRWLQNSPDTTGLYHENKFSCHDAVKQCDYAALPPSCTTTRECCIIQCDVHKTIFFLHHSEAVLHNTMWLCNTISFLHHDEGVLHNTMYIHT